MSDDELNAKGGGSTADLETLKSTRQYLRQRVTVKCKSITTNVSNFTEVDLQEHIEFLKDTSSKLYKYDEKIGSIYCSLDQMPELSKDMTNIEAYEQNINSALRLLNDRKKVLFPKVEGAQSSSPTDSNSSGSSGLNSGHEYHQLQKLRLPEIPLPSYEQGESLTQFFVNFEDILDKYVLSDYERFIYLEKQISGNPLKLIKSLTGAKRCYTEAKKLLEKAFARPIVQKFETIEKLASLKLDTSDPYTFVSEVALLKTDLTDLKIDVEVIFQYFLWTAMPEAFKFHFENLTKNSHPSSSEILENIFTVIDKFHPTARKQEQLSEHVSMAADITIKSSSNENKKFRPCNLCPEGSRDHAIYKCVKYPDPKTKIDRIKELGLCVKCAGIKHESKNCLFKFNRPCQHCKKSNHFSYLCFKGINEAKSVANGVCSIVFDPCAMISSGKSSNLLPTISCQVANDRAIRVLNDSGAQTSFIDASIAKECKFEVLNSGINLTIRGFNGNKQLVTDVVNVGLQVSDQKLFIPAVCVPNITSIVTCENVSKIAQSLQNKGYKVADSYLLTDPKKKLDMIIGVDSFHLLEIGSCKFGENPPSCMLNSQFGVMPVGNSSKLCENINNLPYNPNLDEKVQTNSLVIETNPSVGESEESDTNAGGNNTINCKSAIEISSLFVACDSSFRDLNDDILTIGSSHLNDKCAKVLNYEDLNESDVSDVDQNQIKKFFENVKKEGDRMTVPILWEESNAHMLAQNLGLCKKILMSIKNKISKIPGGIEMVDGVIKEQLDLGIIEEIPDVDQFLIKNPGATFIAHMPVFRMSSETTKCRVVLLSNLKERGNETVSHNQAMVPGPQLNRPIETSLSLLRFDPNVLIFDLKKAFLQLQLSEEDQNKLCFLWFRDASKGDYTLTFYRCKRLPFGLRCSPALLMLSLYYLLVHSVDENDELRELKRLIYDLFYVDNGAVTSKDSLVDIYPKLFKIFNPHGFDLQAFATNEKILSDSYPEVFSSQPETKLLGMSWNTDLDTLSPPKFKLDEQANTARKILSTVAGNYDIFNIGGPMLNRSRIFLHSLECSNKMGWDKPLDPENLKEWKRISRQINESPKVSIDRFIGNRESTYQLITCVDASRFFYGAVVHILDESTGKMSFLFAKNRMLTKNLKTKSIASLELQAVEFGVRLMHKTREELTGSKAVNPIKISKLSVYTDSSICLDWLRAFGQTYSKMNKRPAFIINRLNNITKACKDNQTEFNFIAGKQNPADCITRPLSYKILRESCYWRGPDISVECENTVTLPNPNLVVEPDVSMYATSSELSPGPLISQTRFSSFRRILNVHVKVLTFISKLMNRVKCRVKFLNVLPTEASEIYNIARNLVFKREQSLEYPEVSNYFKGPVRNLKDVPSIVGQLNLFKDANGIIRVKSKISHIGKELTDFPILLSKKSSLTECIINDLHHQLNHSGKYAVLSELRKRFYIPSCFSTVRSILRKCVVCKRFNGRPIQLNQNSYRDFRANPETLPFRNLFLDYIGPIYVKIKGETHKVYLLILSCLWTRAISLQICLDLSVKNFLRAMQLNVYRFGLPSLCISDGGSQIVHGSKIITEHLENPETVAYLNENGIANVTFDQFARGRKELGGLVEIFVKYTKKLIFSAIGKRILGYSDFELLVAECMHIINRRPICYEEALRDQSTSDGTVIPITPEMLIHGRELVSLNVIPDTEPNDDWKPPGSPIDMYKELSLARRQLYEAYENEFLPTLVKQGVEKVGRYLPKKHLKLARGDIVLVKEDFIKRYNLPMARVLDVKENTLGEVTEVSLMKGANREVIKRHVSSLIPLLEHAPDADNASNDGVTAVVQKEPKLPTKRQKRKAALVSSKKSRTLIDHDLV